MAGAFAGLLVAALAMVVVPPALAAVEKPPIFTSVVAGDGRHIDVLTAMAVGVDGTLYSCGYVWHEATGFDITVTRHDDAPLGWSVTWNSPTNEDDTAVDIDVADDGAVYVYGSQGSGLDAQPLLLKFSDSGHLLWEARRDHGYARQLVVGGTRAYTCCVEDNDAAGGTRLVLTAYVGGGAPAWETRYQVASYKAEMAPADMCVDGANRVYVCGGVTGTDLGKRAFVAAFAGGHALWRRLYTGPGSRGARFNAVALCPTGGVYVVGRARSDADDILVTRYSVGGSRVLTTRLGIGDGRRQWATDAAADSLGRLAICGGWLASDKGIYVALLRRDGTLRWSHAYSGDRYFGWAKAVAVDDSDRVCVTGNSRGAYVGGVFTAGPVATYAFSAAGTLRWWYKWPAAYVPSTAIHQLEPHDIAVSQSSNVWVCGSSDDRPITGVDQFILGWVL